MTIREALHLMGYTETKPKFWMKPIGYQVFTYGESENRWVCIFKNVSNHLSVWESKQFQDDEEKSGSYLSQLKSWECWTRSDIAARTDTSFEVPIINGINR